MPDYKSKGAPEMPLSFDKRRQIIDAVVEAHLEGRPLFRPSSLVSKPTPLGENESEDALAIYVSQKNARLLDVFKSLDAAGQLPDK